MNKSVGVLWCVLMLGGTLATRSYAEKKPGWSVKYKGELLSRVLNYENGFEYQPFSKSKRGELLFRFWRSDEYFDWPDENRMADAGKLFDIVLQYVLADSCRFFSKVTLVFINREDTGKIDKIPFWLDWIKARNGAARLPSQRLELLSTLLPIPNLKLENPSQPYKYRAMGFSFPSELRGVKFDATAMISYSNCLAVFIYDYVLRRKNHIISQFFVQFNSTDRYDKVFAPPQYRSQYFITAPIFSNIKKHNATIPFND